MNLMNLIPMLSNIGICTMMPHISELLSIPSEKITVFSRWYHRFVPNPNIRDIDEPGSILFKIKMYIHIIFAILSWLWNSEPECLFIPSFANPTNIFVFARL